MYRLCAKTLAMVDDRRLGFWVEEKSQSEGRGTFIRGKCSQKT